MRPLPRQRVALFKNAPGVFVPGAGRFPLLTLFPARRASLLLPDLDGFEYVISLVRADIQAFTLAVKHDAQHCRAQPNKKGQTFVWPFCMSARNYFALP